MNHRSRGPSLVLRLFSLALLALGGGLLYLQLQRYEQAAVVYPPGQMIAGVPVGGMDRAAAGDQLSQAYNRPVELVYDTSTILMYPIEAGFQLDIESMLDQADESLQGKTFWEGFWDFQTGEAGSGTVVPLAYTYSEERLLSYLQSQIVARYDRPPAAAVPYPGLVTFMPGQKGAELDVEASVPLIEAALQALGERQVILPILLADAPPPPFQNLDVLLRQTVLLSEFDGTLGLYLMNMKTGQEIHFLYQTGEELPTEPDAAFTASSTMKIPIMVSVYRRLGSNPSQTVTDRLYRMIGKSDNTATDWLVENVIEPFYGPLRVSDDMKALGLENTFLAGYFYVGAPLLSVYQTPSNQRTDTLIVRDLYNQTTPSEMGMLLADIYQCAYQDGGSLLAIFPGEITPQECQTMVDTLVEDRNPLLLQAGVPDGTRMAHKHGWISDPYTGVIHDMSDAGIVFTPGGDFVIAIYMYHPTQLIFEPANRLVSDLSRAAYNYFNPPQ